MKRIRVLAEALRRAGRSTSVRALLIALPALAWAGCGEVQSPVGLEQPAAMLQSTSGILPFSPDSILTFLIPPNPTGGDRHAGKLIRARKGGFVQLQGFRVDIPAGALAKDTFVTIDLPTTLPAANYIVADFGPTKLTFKKPVGITLPLVNANLRGIDLATVKVAYWNGSAWENFGGTATPAAVSSTTTHFSTYGAKGGIDTTSGG